MAKFSKHAIDRMDERAPNADMTIISEAIDEFYKTGFHEFVDRICRINDSIVLRYRSPKVLIYPMVNPDDMTIITVYSADFIKRLKKANKFKSRMKSTSDRKIGANNRRKWAKFTPL